MSEINILNLVEDKLNQKQHSKEKIEYLVSAFTNGEISDKHMTMWLKAVYSNSMTYGESVMYTNSIINSGQRVAFDKVDGYIVDKHSTGGVGDKISLILGPILVACGCYVPMIVGRSLGHTGGTLDKLESISGYNGLININNFKRIVQEVGISIIGQTDEICPADRKIYHLRDKTDTVASFPLICGSIMSKKIAEGIQGLVLDIKVGNGAFMKTLDEANKLGDFLSKIGKDFGIDVRYLPTNMDQPLGTYSGLLCEVIESMDALKGNGAEDMMGVVFSLGKVALSMANIKNPKDRMIEAINDGSAYEILCKMISAHGGNMNNIKLKDKNNIEITALSDGKIKFTNTRLIGDMVNFLSFPDNSVDINAGIEFFKKDGDSMSINEPICRIFSNNMNNNRIVENKIHESFSIEPY